MDGSIAWLMGSKSAVKTSSHTRGKASIYAVLMAGRRAEELEARAQRLLASNGSFQAVVARLRSAAAAAETGLRPPLSSSTSFVVPPRADELLMPQALVLAGVVSVNLNRGFALVRVVAHWPPGGDPLTEPPAKSTADDLPAALIHGSRAWPPHVKFMQASSSGAAVRLPEWLKERALILAVVVSTSSKGTIHLSLNLNDWIQPASGKASFVGQHLGQVTSSPAHEPLIAQAQRSHVSDGGGQRRAPSPPSPQWPATLELTLAERLAEESRTHSMHAGERLRASLGLPNLSSCLPPSSEAVRRRAAAGYEEMRADQNRAWAQDSVKRGVAYAKDGKLSQAISAYDHALELDRTSADAYVARGAALANLSRYREAIADFERALRNDPGHQNARKYLETTRKRVGELDHAQPHAPSQSAQGGASVSSPQPPASSTSTSGAPPPATHRGGIVASGSDAAGDTRRAVLKRMAEVLHESHDEDGRRMAGVDSSDESHRKRHTHSKRASKADRRRSHSSHGGRSRVKREHEKADKKGSSRSGSRRDREGHKRKKHRRRHSHSSDSSASSSRSSGAPARDEK